MEFQKTYHIIFVNYYAYLCRETKKVNRWRNQNQKKIINQKLLGSQKKLIKKIIQLKTVEFGNDGWEELLKALNWMKLSKALKWWKHLKASEWSKLSKASDCSELSKASDW